MSQKRSRLLAIDPGTREMGMAIFEGETLIYHGVNRIPARGSSTETITAARKQVLALINDFRPRTLLVEKTFIARSRNGSLLNVVADEIRAVGRRKGLQVQGLAPNTVRKIVCGNGRAGKRDVAKVAVARYPELGLYLNQDRRWKEKHWQNMFDAVALGMARIERDFRG